MRQYKAFVDAGIDNDTAGYTVPQGLRNILIIQGNHEAWMNFIRLRACHRNTKETQYVALKIWEALLKTADGEEMFAWAGPDCMYDKCREGKMSCGDPIFNEGPTSIINEYFPLIARGDG
jgi:thymidylate synthase (FAD)